MLLLLARRLFAALGEDAQPVGIVGVVIDVDDGEVVGIFFVIVIGSILQWIAPSGISRRGRLPVWVVVPRSKRSRIMRAAVYGLLR